MNNNQNLLKIFQFSLNVKEEEEEEEEDDIGAWFPYENDEQAIKEFREWLTCAKRNYGFNIGISLNIYPL